MLDRVNGEQIQKNFNLSSLGTGMYFLVLNTADAQYTHKIVLVK